MSLKEDEAKFEQDFRKKSNEELIYVTSIKKQNRKGKIDHRLLALTESSLRICHARSPYSGKRYFWLDIEKIEEVGLQAVFTFRGTEGVATVISKKRSKLKKIISKATTQITTIALESEKPEGQFKAKSRPIFSALKRFRAKFFWRARTSDKSVQFPQDLDMKYRMFLTGGGAELDIDEFAVPDFLFDDFLDSLLLVPTLRKISLTNPNGNHWIPLATFITSHEGLCEVFTKEAFNDSFREFCSILQSRTKKPIGNLSFGQPSIESEELQLIGNLYKSASILSIRFAFTSFQVSFQKLASLIIKPASKLRSISLDHVQDLRAGEVIPFVQHLDDVSLTYCDLSVSDFLQRARQKGDNFRVSCLNLSGNRVNAEIVSVDIPRSVTRLFVDSPNGAPRDVLNLIMKATKSGTKLSVLSFQSISTGTSDEFENVICQMCKRLGPERSSVETLMWSGNFITPSVLCYFERMDQLKKLSIDGCFERDKMKNIEIFGQFISNNRTITHLSVRGTFQRSLTPDMFDKLMDYLALNRSIQNLAVYHNRLDEQTLRKLSWMLMENRVIKNLFFGDCDIKDPGLLIKFYESLAGRGAPVLIPIPGVELEKMFEEGTIDDAQYLRLRALSGCVEKGSNIPIPVETVVIPVKLPEPSYREVMLREESRRRPETFDFQEWNIHNSGREVTAPPPPNDSKFENIMNTEFSVERLMGEVKAVPKCEVLQ